MKKNLPLLLLSLLLIGLLIAAAVLYNALSASYMPNDVLPPPPTESAPAATDSTEAQTPPEALAPDFTFTDGDGTEHALSDFFGKPTVINFWATWCPPCKGELPAFEAAYLTYGEDINFIMLNLTDGARDTVDGVKRFVADGGYTFPVYYDTAMEGATVYAAYSIPMTVFIDADGQITAKKIGMLSETALQANLAYILDE